MASMHDQQVEDLRFRVLKLLQQQPDSSQRDLAQQLGISNGKMNYCLKALMDKGLVKLENFQNSQHKFNYVYLLTPAGIAEKAALTGRFLKRKMAEYETLQAEIESLKAEISDELPADGHLDGSGVGTGHAGTGRMQSDTGGHPL
jgi:EPS-associated MarR family transcriptional regulator